MIKILLAMRRSPSLSQKAFVDRYQKEYIPLLNKDFELCGQSVKYMRAKALVNMGDVQGFEYLINNLDKLDPFWRIQTIELLQKVTSNDFYSDQKKWKKWLEENRGKIKYNPKKRKVEISAN